MAKKYSKGKVIHRKKTTANRIARKYRSANVPCKVTQVRKGCYRVDKDWS